MNCITVRGLLDALTDGALSDAEAAEVREHLAGCPDCAEEVDRLAEVVSVLREIPRPAAPDGFTEEVMRRLPPRAAARGRVLKWAAIPAGLAAACLLALLAIRDLGPPRPEIGALDVASESRSGREKGTIAPEGDAREGRVAAKSPSPTSGLALESADDAPGGPRLAGGARPGMPGGGLVAGAPAAPDPDSEAGGDEVTYVVRDASPDATAGVLIAELNHRRSRGDSAGPRGRTVDLVRVAGERLESDAEGEPERLSLYVTAAELDYLLLLIRERGDAQVVACGEGRAAGSGPAPADGEAAGRFRILLRFKRTQ